MSGTAGSGRGGFYAGLYWVWGVTRGPLGSAFSALGGVTRVRATRARVGPLVVVKGGLGHHVKVEVDSRVDR